MDTITATMAALADATTTAAEAVATAAASTQADFILTA